jgi:hypothetical protein
MDHNEYNQTYLENLIKNLIEENINLDFKSGLALRNDDRVKREISKDVCAFANSDGGVIIYGIDEHEHKAQKFSFIDGNLITKEWLEQVINTRIQRKIPDLLIVPVRFDNDIRKTIYVVIIPRSSQVPHMTNEKRYYKRYNFESTEMEEYEIRNLYLSVERKNLKLFEPSIILGSTTTTMNKIRSQEVNLKFNIENIGLAIEDKFKLEVSVPNSLVPNGYGGGANLSVCLNFMRDEGNYSIFSIPNDSPIFQNEIITMWNLDHWLTYYNFMDAIRNPIKYKLYYSNDLISKEIFIIEDINHLIGPLNFEDFIPNN